jgi:UDPglucose--hexose-1-phosphate uridylyltransferase
MEKNEPGFIREIRVDPIVPTESVLIATARSLRPKHKEAPPHHDARALASECPFCPGNEARTPPLILAVPGDGPWAVRIVENLYPVLGDEELRPGLSFGVQQAIDGYGRHEVVIDHREHGIRLHEMSAAHLVLLFGVYRERMRQLFERDPRIRSVLVFKNFGPAAGGSIPHTHSQIIATPMVPRNIQDEVRGSREFTAKHGRCVFCTLVDEALTFEATIYDRASGAIRRSIHVGQYVIERGERFIAIKPFASRFEWEVHILPLAHSHDFCQADDADLADLAVVLRRTMARLDAVLEGAQYNYFLHSAPRDDGTDTSVSYHWHLEICPRTSIPTGFELGSGLFVNSLAPEDAARRLREVELPASPTEAP